jgi:hypothetical protein
LESQDEIFTDWTAYTVSSMKKITSDANHDQTFGDVAHNEGRWRRVGDTMEVQWSYRQSTVGGAGTDDGGYVIPIPDGYSINATALGNAGNTFTTVYSGTNPNHVGVTVGDSQWNGTDEGLDYCIPGLVVARGDVTWGVQIKMPNINNNDLRDSACIWAHNCRGFNAEAQLGISVIFKVPIQGWNSNFNPLLSMPLVNIGNNTEQYQLAGWSGIYDAGWFYSTQTPGINTIDKLGTVTNSSTTGWYFTASQRVKVNVSMSGQSTVGSTEPTILMGDPGDIPSTSNPTTLSAYILNSAQTLDTTTPITVSASCVMEPGQRLVMAQSRSTGGVSTDRYRGGVSLLVERDFSNTNMAHIIKPAVATLLGVYPAADEEGTATTGSWTPRVLNTIEGESWFVTLSGTGTTGIGGTNTDFTLEPGTYKLKGRFPFMLTSYTFIRLYDVTNSAAFTSASSQGNWYFKEDIGVEDTGNIFIDHLMTVTSATKYRFQYYATSANAGSWGLGPDSGTVATQLSIGASLQIEKLK